MKNINEEIAELQDTLELANQVGVNFVWQKIPPFNAIDLPSTMFDASIPQGNRYNLIDLANHQFAIIQRLQAQLAERDRVIEMCLEELHRLTGVKDYDLSRAKIAAITKPTEE